MKGVVISSLTEAHVNIAFVFTENVLLIEKKNMGNCGEFFFHFSTSLISLIHFSTSYFTTVIQHLTIFWILVLFRQKSWNFNTKILLNIFPWIICLLSNIKRFTAISSLKLSNMFIFSSRFWPCICLLGCGLRYSPTICRNAMCL